MKRLTPAMKRALVPFLPTLIRRFRGMVRGGRYYPDCPLCEAASKIPGAERVDCRTCAVFGRVAEHPRDNPCARYMPPAFVPWDKADAQRVLDFLLRLQAKQKGERS